MAAALPWVKPRYFDADGNPLSGGKLWVYQAGTSTPAVSYTDSTGVVPNTNPIILDSEGYADVWMAPGSFKLVLMDSNDVVIWTKDKVKPADGGGGGIVDGDYVYTGYSGRFSENFATTGLADTLSKIINLMYVSPAISLAASGNGTVREKGTVVSSTTLTASVTKKSDPIANVKFYQGATLLSTQTSGGAVPSGGTSTYTYSTPFSDNISFSATADDNGATGGPTTVTAGASFTFVYPYYSDAGASGKTAAQVGALTKTVIVSSNVVNKTMTATAGQVFYFAYPASYGALTSILDVSNFETLADWTATTANITGLDGNPVSYRIYEFKNPVVAGSYFYSFRR